jgi:hypothetical protein
MNINAKLFIKLIYFKINETSIYIDYYYFYKNLFKLSYSYYRMNNIKFIEIDNYNLIDIIKEIK